MVPCNSPSNEDIVSPFGQHACPEQGFSPRVLVALAQDARCVMQAMSLEDSRITLAKPVRAASNSKQRITLGGHLTQRGSDSLQLLRQGLN